MTVEQLLESIESAITHATAEAQHQASYSAGFIDALKGIKGLITQGPETNGSDGPKTGSGNDSESDK